MKNKKWFTLLEVLLSIIILWMFIWTVINIYLQIKWSDWRVANKRLLTAEASDLMDKIHDSAIDYTIDYEEYFNRKLLPDDLRYSSSYWNSWEWYYCANYTNSNNDYNLYWVNDDGICERVWYQKYLEYYFQHRIINPDYWKLNNRYNEYVNWPIAVNPNTWLNYLFLISHDGSERYYFRVYFETWVDLNGDWSLISTKNEWLYRAQMLKLKWYDAWKAHNFSSRWAYDWFIDTWVCDRSQWFSCSGYEVVTWYNLPLNDNDWWVNITSDNVTVSDIKIDIFPTQDPYLLSWDDVEYIDPYAKISFTMNMFWIESEDEITLTTTLSFKNSYSRYEIVEYSWYIAD